MKCIDTERQLPDIFTIPLDAAHFASLWGGGDLVFIILMAWFDGELVFYFVYFCFSFTFPSCSPKLILFHLLY
jgi:hypothetical protein